MRNRLRLSALMTFLVLTALAAACDRKELAPGISDSTFVSAMAGLRRLPAAAMVDSASRVRARDSVLRRYRLTPVQLESAASALAADPERANAVWIAIERKMNTPDTVRGPRAPRPQPTKR